MKKIVYMIVFLMVAILMGSAVHGSEKGKRHREIIRCAPLKQAVVRTTVKINSSALLLPSPWLL
jgi:hypothetical protein